MSKVLAYCQTKLLKLVLVFTDPVSISFSPAGSIHVAGTGLVLLSCGVQGLPIPMISWLKDGQILGSDARFRITYNPVFIPNEQVAEFGLATGSLSIQDLVLGDEGSYICRANNTGAPGITFTVDSTQADITVECKLHKPWQDYVRKNSLNICSTVRSFTCDSDTFLVGS